MRSFDNRPVAIVTGASRGLGKAIARRLVREGYDVSLAARSERALIDIQQELLEEGASALVTAVDLTKPDERERLVATTLGRMGRVDLLVNNAGVSSLLTYVNSDWSEVGCQVDLNLVAPMHLSNLVLPHLLDRGNGSIVNVSSFSSWMKLPGPVTYATTKACLELFTTGLRNELEGTGVSASAVIPAEPLSPNGSVSPAQVANQVISAVNRPRESSSNDRPPMKSLQPA